MPTLNLDQVREAILRLVESNQGLKGPDLAVKLVSEFMDTDIDSNTILGMIETLVESGQLIEVEYTLPWMNYRIKSFYLPKGTEVVVSGK